MSILQNAIDSIEIGLEDYNSSEERRLLSATRNVFAGILLLFKHRLSEMSPDGSDEALIKQKVLPKKSASGEIIWRGKGPKTVDVQSIKERFGSLGITVDWKRLDEINRYRNEIEHYYSSLKKPSVEGLIANSFLIIRDFITDHLKEDPRDLLSHDAWQTLIDANDVYEREKAACDNAVDTLSFYFDEIADAIKDSHCWECGSGLLAPTVNGGDAPLCSFECKACGSNHPYTDIANHAISEYYSADAYRAATDGGDVPIIDCPFCFEGNYVVQAGLCVACGSGANHECEGCRATIPPEEINDGGLCGYCVHKYEKFMRE